MRQLFMIVGFDLRQRIRDRSVLLFGLVVPLALMGVLNLLFSGLDESTELQPVTVAASVPADDPLASAITGALQGIGAMDVTVREVPADEVRDRTADGDATLGITVPEGFTPALTSGEQTRVQIVEGDGGGLESDVLISVTRGTVDRLTAGAEATAAGRAQGLPPDELARIAREAAAVGDRIALAEGRAADHQLTSRGTLVAGQAGLFLLFTVGFGVLGLLAEREQGTMARLQSMPMRPSTVVAAKALTGFLLGVFATSFLLTVGSMLFGVDFGDVFSVAVLVVGVVAAATSLTFVVARIARTAEQANVVQSIIAVVLGMAGGAFFPIPASGWAATIIDLNPIAAFIAGLGITSGGGDVADLGTPLLIMVGFGATCLLVSRLIPDRAAA
ncbi:ABC-2 type transport system permease protein [Haloactinopolyspora alba]|uniref:ABC-2 type transport system permease protein n=1 Tax=Haloactinopolyspora alba TaxID=648780 RepID=A0A2P8EFU7_9ACTN|nr:ABC transporter permease [Haloactinopolyspora alba]PSL08345.1 ABC-2 type transport system permease protein [Haloactinopolyspora alba]